jgi:hypothetical protein
MAGTTPGRFNWNALLDVFQRVKYRSAVAMLTVAVLAMAVVFGIVATRANSSTVQIAVIVAAALTAVAFFAAIILVVKILGPYALLSGSQVLSYSRMEFGAKGIPNPPVSPPIPDPRHPPQQLPPAEEEEGP